MTLLPIQQIAAKLGLADEYLEPLGRVTGKIRLELLTDPNYTRQGKLILVTGTTPTTAGEGKTVTGIGLTQGLDRIGKRVVITSREPSIGPVFGMKGGGAGGGLAKIEPAEKINLHFHGDFHAIAAAHNILAALLDTHLNSGNALNFDLDQIVWPRTVDICDRALRQVTTGIGKGNGPERRGRFVITAASEIMAIMALAKDRQDLRARLNRIVLGFTSDGKAIHAESLHATGSLMALLNEAILPNLAQTSEGTPALVHIGPFANIATGTSSVISQRMGLKLADYVVNEVGFASDLGGEKYFDVVMRTSGIEPAAAVLVTSAKALREQGQGELRAGFANLDKHLSILKRFGVPAIVAINHFPGDAGSDLEAITAHCAELGTTSAVAEPFSTGGAGCIDLATRVAEAVDRGTAAPKPVYELSLSLEDKVRAVAREVYGAEGVEFSELATQKLAQFAECGFAGLPICIAKTQYSLSDNPKLPGAPTGWTLHVTDAAVSAGAGFVVILAGKMLLMPGMPANSRAHTIDVDDDGNILGVS